MAQDAFTDRHLHARLKARQLALLVALHERRSLRQAASEVAISQPAATKMLQDLEAAFGAPLFERHARGMEPTVFGDALARYARGILIDLGTAREEIAALASGAQGKLRVGVVTGAVPRLLVPALHAVRQQAPGMQVFVLVNATEVLAAALREGTLEVGIGAPLAPSHLSGLTLQPLAREPLCVVARPAHPLCRVPTLQLRDLRDVTWILQPPGSAVRDVMERLLARAGITAGTAIIETVSIVATLALLQDMDGVSVLPLDLARHYEQHRMLARLPVVLPGTTEYVLLTRADRQLSPLAEAFRRAVNALPANGRKPRKAAR